MDRHFYDGQDKVDNFRNKTFKDNYFFGLPDL